MEGMTLTREDHEAIASLAAIKTFGLIREHLKPQEESKIKINKSYSALEVSDFFEVTSHTIRNWHDDKKECLLRKNKIGRYTGASVKAEYERRNGKN